MPIALRLSCKPRVAQITISEGKILNGHAYLVFFLYCKSLKPIAYILIRQLYVHEYDNPVGCLLVLLLRSHYKVQCHICHLCCICEVRGAKAEKPGALRET